MADEVELYRSRKQEQREKSALVDGADALGAAPKPQDYIVRKNEKRQQDATLTASRLVASGNPDENAQDAQLAQDYRAVNPEVTAPPSFVRANRDRMRADVERLRMTTSLSSSPMLMRWLGDPDNARVASDDVGVLANIEAGLGHTRDALKRGVVDRGGQVFSQIRSDALLYGARQIGTTFAERYRAARGDNYGYGIFGRPVEPGNPPLLAELGADPVGAFFSAAAGGVVAATNELRGNTREGNVLRAVDWQRQAAEFAKRAQETPVSPTAQRALDALSGAGEALTMREAVRRTLDLAVNDPGALTAMVAEVGIESVGSMIPAAVATFATRNPAVGAATMGATSYAVERNLTPVDFFTKRGYDLTNPDDVQRMLSNPELMKEAADLGHTRGLIIGALDWVSGGVAGRVLARNPAADAALQALVQGGLGGGGEGLAQYATEGQVNFGEVVVEALAEFSTAPIDVAAIGARKLGERKAAAQRGQATGEAIEKMSADATVSKLRERSPAKFRAFVEQATQGGAMETMYIPAEAFIGYFQSQGVTIEQAAELLPGVDLEQVRRAAVTGEDVALPTATYMERVAGSEMDAFVTDNAKFAPEDMTRAEAQAFEEDEVVAEARVAAEQEAARVMREAERDITAQVEAQITEQLVAAGRPRVAAQQEAQLYPAFYKALAQRMGTTVEDVINRYRPPTVQGPEVSPLQEKRVDSITRDLAGMRAWQKDPKTVNETDAEYYAGVEQAVRDAGLDPATATDEEVRAALGTILSQSGELSAYERFEDAFDSDFKRAGLDTRGHMTFSEHKGTAYLDHIGANSIGEGFGTEAMTLFTRAADEYQVPLTLSVASDADEGNGPGVDALFDWYESFGFERVSGSDMRREPQPWSDPNQLELFQSAPPVDSDAFKKWFGDSKVVDENGEPLVVYHGTNANAYSGDDFDTFNARGERGGAFFSSSDAVAAAYGEQTYAVYLSMQNPLVVDAGGVGWSSITADAEVSGEGLEAKLADEEAAANARDRKLLDEIFAELETWEPAEDEETTNPQESGYAQGTLGAVVGTGADVDTIAKRARKLGFDGLIVRNVKDGPVSDSVQPLADTYVVFGSAQIKSATDNAGTFDPNDPNIYAQGERGRILIPGAGVADGQAVIDLFQNADLSTFLHESSHFFLSVLQDAAAAENAPQAVKDMHEQAKTWWRSNAADVAKEASKVVPAEGYAQGNDAFQKWFGDSKVVDENGEPLVVYHGTDAVIDAPDFAFQTGRKTSRRVLFSEFDAVSSGVFFAPSEGDAAEFGRNVGSFYVRIEKPFTPAADKDDVLFILEPMLRTNEYGYTEIGTLNEIELREDEVDSGVWVEYLMASNPDHGGLTFDWEVFDNQDVVARMRERGYDGAKAYENDTEDGFSWFVTEPSAIKSTSNTGGFDAADDRVMYQGGEQTGDNKVSEQDVVTYLDNGTTGDAAKDRAVDVALQEQWARAFETYLLEGKAPTPALRAAFEQFRAWLMEVYRRVKGDLNVQVTDDIRQVFDMLLATDDDIAKAETDNNGAMIAGSAAELGIDEADYQRLAELHREAQDEAAARAIRDAMAPIRKMRDEAYRARREEIRGEVAAEVNARPVYRAIEWMGNKRWLGVAPEDQPKIPTAMRLNKEQLVERYGPGILRTLPRGSFRVYTPGGMDIDEAAGWFGFSSGDEMVKAMEAAPRRDDVIANETDRRAMAELARDEGLAEGAAAATEAFHSDKRGDYIAAELRTLNIRIGGKTGTSTASYARQVAKRTLGAMKARDAVASNRYLSAERQAAEAAQVAFVGGDLRTATNEKRKQLFNHMMYTESRRIAEEVAKTEKLAKRLSSKGTRKNLANDYLGAIDDVLEQYDFRKTTRKKEDNRARMLAYVEMMKAAGRENEIAIPQHILDNAKAEPYMTLPVDRLRGVYATLKNIESTARRAQKLIDAKAERDMDAVVNDIGDAFNANVKPRPPARVETKGERLRRAGRQFLDLVLNADTLLREIDGFKDGEGATYRNLKQGIDEATARLQVRRQQAAEKFEELYSVYSVKERNQMAVPKFVPELGVSMTKWDMLAIVLNMGNEDNLQRLTDPKVKGSFTQNQLDSVLQLIDKRDMDFVQSVWDYVGSFYAEIAAREKRVTGVAPQRVEPLTLNTPHGQYKGGYYPLKYDPRLSSRVAEETQAETMKNMMAGRFGKAQTRNGHTKERAQSSGRPVLLDIGVLHSHINTVLHDLELSEQVTNTWRILQEPRVKGLFYDAGKQVDHQALELWVQDVASGQVNSANVLAKTARFVKSGFTVSKLAFNLSTVAVQITGIAQSMVVIGKKDFAKGAIMYASHPVETSRDVLARSDFMAERETTFNKDIYDIMGDIKVGPKAGLYRRAMQNWIGPAAFLLMQKVQFYSVDMPTWLGAYQKALRQNGGVEDEAVKAADRAVARAQASGIFSDRSPVERGTISADTRQNDFIRLFTALGSYMFAKANVAYERTSTTDFRSPREILSYTIDMAMLFTVEAVLYGAIKGTLPGMGDDDDDDESWAAFLARETALSIMSTMPFVRDLASPLQGFSGGGSYGSVAETLTKPFLQASQGELDKAFIKSLVDAGGMLLHLPSTQVNRFIDAGWRASEGEEVSPVEYIMGKR